MSNVRTRQLRGTRIRLRRPVWGALGSLASLNVYAAWWCTRVNRELHGFGQGRDGMPFDFIEARPRWCGVAVLVGTLGLAAWALILVQWATSAGRSWSDLPSILTTVLLAAPLWLVALGTQRRIHTAQMLAGLPAERRIRWPVGCALTLLTFPAAQIYMQRHLNGLWALYVDAQDAEAP